MNDDKGLILDEFFEKKENQETQVLLPWWIITFSWIFLLLTWIVPAMVIVGLNDIEFDFSLYRIVATDPFNAFGFILMFLFLLKGITGFGFLTEKKWAVDVGIIDATIGIIISLVITFAYPMYTYKLDIAERPSFELVLLIPYLYRLLKVRMPWNRVYRNIESLL